MSPTPQDGRTSRVTLERSLSRRGLLGASGAVLAGAALSGRVAGAEADAVVRRPNGGYVFAGYRSATGSNPFWIVGTDANGELLWERTAGGRDYNYVFSMIRTADDGYAVTGITTDQHPAEPDVRLVRLTADS